MGSPRRRDAPLRGEPEYLEEGMSWVRWDETPPARYVYTDGEIYRQGFILSSSQEPVEPNIQVFTIAIGGDDQYIGASEANTYPPSSSITRYATGTFLQVSRTRSPSPVSGVIYEVYNALLKWDTSTLDDALSTQAASLTLNISAVYDANSRSLTGEWYSWDGTSDADYTSTSSATAFSVLLSSLIAGDNEIPLTGYGAGVSETGYTYLRLHISGGQPTGTNYVYINPFEAGVALAPRLSVTSA